MKLLEALQSGNYLIAEWTLAGIAFVESCGSSYAVPSTVSEASVVCYLMLISLVRVRIATDEVFKVALYKCEVLSK